jgi:hypothetical protein
MEVETLIVHVNMMIFTLASWQVACSSGFWCDELRLPGEVIVQTGRPGLLCSSSYEGWDAKRPRHDGGVFHLLAS